MKKFFITLLTVGATGPLLGVTLSFDNDAGTGAFATSTNWDPDTSLGTITELADDLTIGSAFTVNHTSGITWADANVGSLTLAGSLNVQWLGRSDNVTILSTGVLELRGGADPLPFGPAIDLALGAEVNFLAESVADAESEHLGKFTVNGSPAALGTNVSLVSSGAGSSVLTAIPEPSSLAFAGLAFLGLLSRRRK